MVAERSGPAVAGPIAVCKRGAARRRNVRVGPPAAQGRGGGVCGRGSAARQRPRVVMRVEQVTGSDDNRRCQGSGKGAGQPMAGLCMLVYYIEWMLDLYPAGSD